VDISPCAAGQTVTATTKTSLHFSLFARKVGVSKRGQVAPYTILYWLDRYRPGVEVSGVAGPVEKTKLLPQGTASEGFVDLEAVSHLTIHDCASAKHGVVTGCLSSR
jgi:hypothetical protein